MNKLLLPIILLFGITSYSNADFEVPSLKIVGAEDKVSNDDFVDLYVETIGNPGGNWVGVSYDWKVFHGYKERKFSKLEEDEKIGIRFVPPKDTKNVLVIVTATHLFVTKNGDKSVYTLKSKSTKVIVEFDKTDPCPPPITPPTPDPIPPTPPTPPPPDPVPPVPPDPVVPDVLGLVKISWDAASTVPAESKKSGAVILSKSFKDYAKKIRDEKLFEVDKILPDLTDKNNKALDTAGISRKDWTKFGIEIGNALSKLYKEGKLNIATDFADAFDEISTGLSKVK